MTICLVVNGLRLAPEAAAPDHLVFRLKLPAREIRLISGHAVPADIEGGTDLRRLGVALRQLRWRQGTKLVEHSIASPGFIDGFHPLERYNDAEGSFRWTNGDAGLPPGVIPGWHGEVELSLSVSQWRGSMHRASPRPEAALLTAFENIGDNCELAVVQRHYGAEQPLSLLRWAGTTYETLLDGLEKRFLGLGDPEVTDVAWVDTDYRLRTPYLSFHTSHNTPLDETGVSEIHVTGCATLRLLRRKFLKDIATARRIFVFKTAEPAFGEIEMHRLHNALRAIGPASLLCVRLTPPASDSPRVERLAAGLYAGTLQYVAFPDVPFDAWLQLCSRTLTLHYAN